MATTVALMSLLVEHLWDRLPGSPYFASPAHVGVTALILCVGALLAFMMVWVEFTVIAQTSALTFMVAGTFKEVVTGTTPTTEQSFANEPWQVSVHLKTSIFCSDILVSPSCTVSLHFYS